MFTAIARGYRRASGDWGAAVALVAAFLDHIRGRKEPTYDPHLELPEVVVKPDSPFEHETDNEHAALRGLQELTARSVVTRLRASLEINPIAKALRDQHPKSHGCLHAQFVVDRELSPELVAGVFQPGATYDALVRFSNSASTPRPDKKGDGRGMAIKLMNVPRESILTGEHRSRVGQGTQDFLLTNFPVFFVSTPHEYLRFLRIMSESLLTRWLKLFFFFAARPRKFLIFVRTAFNWIDSPLTEPYHSLTPYLLGQKVVRYKVLPVLSSHGGAASTPDKSNPSFLRDALTRHLNRRPAEFDFLVQVLKLPASRLVEDPSRHWSRSESDTVHVARIVIPRQTDFTSKSAAYDCEKIVFNAWNALPQHRPLGGINRSRHAVYLAVSRTRHSLNMVEPLS